MSETKITIKVNGKNQQLTALTSLDEHLNQIIENKSRKGLAVCLNLEVIPSEEWASTRLQDGDRLEIIIAAAGG